MSICKNFKLLASLTISILLPGLFSVYAQEFPKSLFWEISGNGLTKPSYIYGTIHIKDKRVFNLSDSVLIKLDECPAVAIEIDLDSARQLGLKAGLEHSGPAGLLGSSSEPVANPFSDDEEKIVRKGLAEMTGMDENSFNLDSPAGIYFLINQFKYSKGDMPEILDLRIYNMAKSKDKKLLGIETLEEHIKIFSSIAGSDLKKAILSEFKNPAGSDSLLHLLVETYCLQDLRKINSMLKSDESEYPDFYHQLFEVRNIKMAERIKDLVNLNQTFFAVGVGHLYGENGLISLLAKKGFSLRPVYPSYSKRLAENFINFRAENNLKKFTSLEGAFEAGFPNEPVYDVKKLPLEGSADSLSLFFLISLDNEGTSSYMIKYNDIGNGRYIPNDSLYFEQSLAGALKNSNGTLVYKRFKKCFNLPAVEYRINLMNKISIKVLQLLRGSRDYYLLASQQEYDSLSAEKFFASFRLLDFMPVSWKSFSDSSKSFSIDFPAAPIQQEADMSDNQNVHYLKNYMSSDPNSGIAYLLQEQDFSEYYYVESDSALFALGIKASISKTDSLISQNSLSYDGMPAMDIVVRSSITQNSKRIRFVLNGQRFYLLLSFTPEVLMNNENVTHFFNSLKISERAENPELLFADKTEKLLNDLVSPDMKVRTAALAYLPNNAFKAESVSQIYGLLKKSFADDTNSTGGTRARLFGLLESVNDSTTCDFISKLYFELPENSPLMINALKVLAEINTAGSVDKLKELLLSRPPAGEAVWRVFTPFYFESSNLARLFPDVLTLLGKENYKLPIYELVNTYIDSLPRMKSGVQSFGEQIKSDFRIYAAKRDSLKSIQQKDSEEGDSGMYDVELHNIAEFIDVLKSDTETEKTLIKLAKDSSGYVSLPSAIALLKLNGRCEQNVLVRLAENKHTRNDLYSQLLEIGKKDLFPSKFKTKEIMAEGNIYAYILEEECTPVDLVLLDKKEVATSGEKGIYYLYKFNLEDDEDKWYVGISGPQPADSKEPVAYGTATGTDFTLFNNNIEEHWKELLPEENN